MPRSTPFEVTEADVIFGLMAETSDDVLTYLGRVLIDRGDAEEGFIEALLERSKEFPVGLPSPVPIAIPHADPTHLLRSCVVPARLDRPVPFRQMDDPAKTLDVRLVVLLAFTDGESHLDWMSRFVDAIQDGEAVEQLLREPTARSFAKEFRKMVSRKGST